MLMHVCAGSYIVIMEPFRTIRNGNRIDQWWSMVFNQKKYGRSSLMERLQHKTVEWFSRDHFLTLQNCTDRQQFFKLRFILVYGPWMSRTGTIQHELDPCPLVLGIKISDDQWWNIGKPFYCIQYGNLQFHLPHTPPPKSWPEKTVKAFTYNALFIYRYS